VTGDSFASRVSGNGVKNSELGRLLLENIHGRNLRARSDEQACYNSQSANSVTECLQDLLARGRRLFNFFNACAVSHFMELVQPNDPDHCLQKLRRATHAVGSWKERALRGRAVGEKMTLQLLLILQHKISNEGRRLKGHLGVNSADEAPR
jgi:hypothetical protein